MTRLVLYLPATLIAYLLSGGAALIALVFMAGPGAASLGDTWGSAAMLVLTLATCAATLGVTALFLRLFDRSSLGSLGLGLSSQSLRDLARGFALGALLMGGIFVVELVLGGYAVKYDGSGQPAIVVARLLAVALTTFVFVAVSEEVLARGYLLQTLERQWGTPVALVVSSTIFGLLHLGNPSASILSTATLVFAGLLLGAAYLVVRNLWLPIGLHWTWNFFQGPAFGFPVSGLTGPSLLDTEPVGPAWLTGGGFGPEASLLALLVEILATAILLARAARTGRLALSPSRSEEQPL